MLEYPILLVGLLRAMLSSRADPVTENLLLHRQLAVLSRPTRKRPRLRTEDKLFGVLVRALRRDWRQHRVLVGRTPSFAGSVTPGRCSRAGASVALSAVPG